jgi:hypothetical protein
MKTITASELYHNLSEYLALAQVEDIVIALDNGKLLRLSVVEPRYIFERGRGRNPRFLSRTAAQHAEYHPGEQHDTPSRHALVAEIIAELDQEDAYLRQSAAQKLIAMGQSAIQPLSEYCDRLQDMLLDLEAHYSAATTDQEEQLLRSKADQLRQRSAAAFDILAQVIDEVWDDNAEPSA